MIVADASAILVALVDDGPFGEQAWRRLRGQTLAAPHLVDLEVTSVIRGMQPGGRLSDSRALGGLDDLADLALVRAEHRLFLHRCWELRDNLTVYDACYVALAELLQTTLVTADARLAHAPGLRCAVEVLRAA